MTLLEEIAAWRSSAAPAWMGEALTRLLAVGDLTERDVDDLVERCKVPHGLAHATEEATVAAAPAALDPAGARAVGRIVIDEVTHVADVNALAPGETLRFAPTGLTIVYGRNGAGKSGFARILKRACRARGSGRPVLPNQLSERPVGSPTARIAFSLDGVSTQFDWIEGGPASSALRGINVFDTSAADVYLTDKTDVRFRPFGLDALDRLAATCGRVKARLEAERIELRRAPTWPQLARGTSAARLIENLSALTPIAEVDAIPLTEAERTELQSLREVLATARSEDPKAKAADLGVKARRVRELRTELESLTRALSDESFTKLRGLLAAAEAAAAAASASELPVGAVLAGVGSGTWRAMWIAASTFSSEQAYPGHRFPLLVEGSHCVLCQQLVGADAAARLGAFDLFMRNVARDEAAAKKSAADGYLAEALSIVPGERTKAALDDTRVQDPALAALVDQFYDLAAERRSALAMPSAGHGGAELRPPLGTLAHLIDQLNQRARELIATADPEGRRQSEARDAELTARELLAPHRVQLLAEIARRARLNALESCMKDVDTRSLTNLSIDLTKRYVSQALVAAFTEELEALGFRGPKIVLVPAGGQKGVMHHQVAFKYPTRTELSHVVSEGEARCISVAAFMAEMRAENTTSTLVFDDPVSSLDHEWRGSVAARLVREAKARQVIVFTHDLQFLRTLVAATEEAGTGYEPRTISKPENGQPGRVSDDIPWDGAQVKQRLGQLRVEWQAAEKAKRLGEDANYVERAARIYSRLRTVWERAVEEVLLNDAVQRFRGSIETSKMRKWADIEQQDVDVVDAGMTKCSKFMGGHDRAEDDPFPGADELKVDIDTLESWVAAIRKRRVK